MGGVAEPDELEVSDVEDEVCRLLLLCVLVDSLAGGIAESAPESGEGECFLF